MRRILTYMTCLVILAVLPGCDDGFMDRIPEASLNDGTFWKSEQDLRSYANYFYVQLDGVRYKLDDASDNQQNTDQSKSDDTKFIWNLYSVPANGGGWSKAGHNTGWGGIRSCNYFLTHYAKAYDYGVPDEVVKQYLGEILYFKAELYFYKVRRFGDVPWLSRDLDTDDEELYYPRDSRKMVMDSVAFILDRAAEYLPETSSDNRLTKYAALALKSRACLFEGTFRKYHGLGESESMLRQSADASKAIMDSRLFDLYSTGNPQMDYKDFFVTDNLAKNKEAVFYIHYEQDLRENNVFYNFFQGNKSSFTKDFVESYLCADGLPRALSPLYRGDARYEDEMTDRDPRMRMTVYNATDPLTLNDDGSPNMWNVTVSNIVPTGYRMIKYIPRYLSKVEQNHSAPDVCLYRYGEVLLNYAEAMAELGECTQDILDITVNRLRKRVGFMAVLSPEVGFVDPDWPEWEVPVSPLINEIRRERRIELACEGFRFDDLCRWKAGRLMENPKTYQGIMRNGKPYTLYGIDPENPAQTRKWYDKLYLHPLPINALTANPNLVQNPGW